MNTRQRVLIAGAIAGAYTAWLLYELATLAKPPAVVAVPPQPIVVAVEVVEVEREDDEP